MQGRFICFKPMLERKTNRVADLFFCVEGIQDEPTNLQPFRAQPEEENNLFCLRVVPSLPEAPWSFYFRTNDGPGFPQIVIDEAPQAWRFTVYTPLENRLAGTLVVDKDFRDASLLLHGAADTFALNNALMLLYAFSSARHGALQMHASVVMNGGFGYLFLGPSGTGKSTHSSLWLKHIPGTELLNDDNPILRLLPDGSARVYGSPWSGKTPCYKQMYVPAGAVVRIRQAPHNAISRLAPIGAYASLMASASSFRPFKELAEAWHRTLEGLVAALPCYTLECLPDRDAAELCYRTVHHE